MKYIKIYEDFENEPNIEKAIENIQNYCDSYLAFLKDENFIIETKNYRYYGLYDIVIEISKSCNNVKDGFFRWNYIKDYLIPFIQILNDEYKLTNISITDNKYTEKTLTIDDVLNDTVKGLVMCDLTINFDYPFNGHDIKTFEEVNYKEVSKSEDIYNKIKNLKKVPSEYKEVAYKLIDSITKAGDGKITGLRLHPDLEKRIKEKNLPYGFSMGIDKDGFYVHTHRARSKSKKSVNEITEDEIRKTDSTG